MTLTGRNRLVQFIKKHGDARSWINNWLAEAEDAIWKSPNDIKSRYSSASILQENTVIFNVKGGAYRLEASVSYKNSVVSVMWIGTHAEYDKRNRKR